MLCCDTLVFEDLYLLAPGAFLTIYGPKGYIPDMQCCGPHRGRAYYLSWTELKESLLLPSAKNYSTICVAINIVAGTAGTVWSQQAEISI